MSSAKFIMDSFTGKKVVVMGLGTFGGGVGTARFFAKHGANVLVTDLKSEEELQGSIQQLKDYSIEFVLGRHREEDFTQADLIVKNPSVPSNSSFIKLARENNVRIEMAESLFMKLAPSENIIGITGTRGKSTTVQMVYEILKTSGKKVVIGGNVRGVSTLELLDAIDGSYYVVLELSSWMLEGFGWEKISPKIAVITNIYPDHLNRYDGMDEYVADKKNIYLFQNTDDVLILNKDNKYSEEFAKEAKGKVTWFSKTNWSNADTLLVPGEHNKANAEAAKTVGRILNIPDEEIVRTLANFTGLNHRLEQVAVINDITYINDSASTTPIAAITALNAFPDKNIILITGGNTKNLPMDEFVELIKKRVKKVILYEGTALSSFESLTKAGASPATTIQGPFQLGEFDKVVTAAQENATPGDIVLFSPGLTHLPVINEFERGDQYKTAVARIQEKSSH